MKKEEFDRINKKVLDKNNSDGFYGEKTINRD